VAEIAFLEAVTARLGAAALAPAPATIGVAEPATADALPALVVSLEASARAGAGIGERTSLVEGALPWQATIDLAHPVLPEEPSFVLLDASRTHLVLPHGGLVRHDGSSGPLGGSDLTVAVNGQSRVVVTQTPTGNQVSADALVGTLTFGTAVPATGLVTVTYFVAQWEQRVRRIAGTLRLDVCAAAPDDAVALSAAAVEALAGGAPAAVIPGLVALGVTGLSSVGAAEPASANLRRRTIRFAFEFEQVINRPDSSGGIIQRVPITTHLRVVAASPQTGAITETDFVETG
jgi:hypothetical protein